MSKCAMCGNSEHIPNAKNQNTKIGKLLNKICTHCRKKTLKRIGDQPTSKTINDLYATINGLLTSHQVRQIRKRLNLTQKEAAQICGGGPNAFSRYERGETIPTKSTSNLLRLLLKHPQEINFLLKFNMNAQKL